MGNPIKQADVDRIETISWNLDPLFAPNSIAIVGASETSFFGSMLYKNLTDYDFKGSIFPINPKYDQVYGLKSYNTLSDLPIAPDTVAIAVRRELVVGTILEAIKIGAKSATIISAGFGETDEDEWKGIQEEIKSLSIEHSFPILGPNCLGSINVHKQVNALSAPVRGGVHPGNISLIMQSGGLLQGLLLPFYQRGIGFSYAISSGNNMCLDLADYIEHSLKDGNTDVICAYVEGIQQSEKLKRVAQMAINRGKPIIILKVGKTDKAVKAALAHTGSLAGADHVTNAFFEKYGIIRVSDFDELVETAAIFSRLSKTAIQEKTGIGFLSGSGGAVGLVSDLSDDLKIDIAELEASTVQKLENFLPPSAIVLNPVDATAQILNDFELFRQTMKTLSEDKNVGIIVYLMALGLASNDVPRHQKLLEIMVDAAKDMPKPLVICSLNTHSLDQWQGDFLKNHQQFAFTQGLSKTLSAVQSLLNYKQFIKKHKSIKLDDEFGNMNRSNENNKKTKAIEFLKMMNRKVLTEYESKRLLEIYEIPVCKEYRVQSMEEAIQNAQSLGYPLVMKIDSPDILHKSDAGVVKVGIQDQEELILAYSELIQNAKKFNHQAEIKGVLLQEYVEGGIEVILGVTHDKQFGPVIMFGLGGIYVEVFKDHIFKLPPLSYAESAELIQSTKGYQLLKGMRGNKPKDIDALIQTIAKISNMAVDLKDYIKEMDINPLLVMDQGKGVKAVDGLFVLR